MSLLKSIAGWSAFGLSARFLQLGIQQRSLWSRPSGHFVAVATFGTFGYFAYHYELRVEELIKERHAVLARNRQRVDEASMAATADAS